MVTMATEEKCPECGGAGIEFRGAGANMQHKTCSRWKEPGHPTEAEIRAEFSRMFRLHYPTSGSTAEPERRAVEPLTVREAARRRMPLDVADVQALEGALSVAERERDQLAAENEAANRQGASDSIDARTHYLANIGLRARIADLVAASAGQAAELTALRADNAKTAHQRDVARACVNVDMTGLANALARVVEIANGYSWIADGENGSYAGDEDPGAWLRTETGHALQAIREEAVGALRLSGDIANIAFGAGPLFAEPATLNQLVCHKGNVDPVAETSLADDFASLAAKTFNESPVATGESAALSKEEAERMARDIWRRWYEEDSDLPDGGRGVGDAMTSDDDVRFLAGELQRVAVPVEKRVEEARREALEAGRRGGDQMKIRMVQEVGTSADRCRERGWKVGDILEGDEGYGPTRILITAIGERSVLARDVSQNGRPRKGSEGNWSLMHRDWKRVEPAGGEAKP